MDTFQKYSRLMLYIVVCFISFVLLGGLLIFLLKTLSITVSYIPGLTAFYGYVVTISPYLIFFVAWYIIYRNFSTSKKIGWKAAAAVCWSAGILLCIAGFVLASLYVFMPHKEWLRLFDENHYIGFVLQLVLIVITSILIAAGTQKETHWLQRPH